MLQATNFTQSIPAKVTVEYCRLDQGGAPGVDGGDVLHDGLHLVRHLQVLQVTLIIMVILMLIMIDNDADDEFSHCAGRLIREYPFEFM